MRIGLISDTHGLMRAEALAALAGSAHIVHAGDIGSPDVLEALAAIAPVTAVRGNNDMNPWARNIPDTARVECSGVAIYVLHDLNTLDIDPVAQGCRVVVAGHSHRPAIVERNSVLFVNPGSAGPRRFSLPIAVAHLDVDGADVRASIVPLAIAADKKYSRSR